MHLANAIVAVVSLLGLQRAAPTELDARDVLERMREVYAKCETYRDSGVVKTLFVTERGDYTEAKPFTTAFERSARRFRFEFLDRRCEDEFYRYLVWKNGDDVRTWWDVQPGLVEGQSLALALAGATGVSGGSAHTVPSLLRGLTGSSPVELRRAERRDDAELGGTPCFVVAGGEPDAPVVLWIERETFLLRRIDERNQFDDFRSETTTTYEPVVGGEIPEALLAFDPPVVERESPVPPQRALHRPGPDDLDAQAILLRVADVYAACGTYRDSGVVTKVTFFHGERCTERVPFTTAFVRPDRFRYECRVRDEGEDFDRYLVWRAGDDVRSWSGLLQEVERQPLNAALAGPMVATSHSAAMVPTLLMPHEIAGVAVAHRPEAERMQDETLGATPCFVVQGPWMGATATLWIDQQCFVIRRADLIRDDSVTSTLYEPVLDEPIADALLVFDPPAEAR